MNSATVPHQKVWKIWSGTRKFTILRLPVPPVKINRTFCPFYIKENVTDNPQTRSDCTEDMYRWYAKILNRTAILLDSPEKDFSRLDNHQGQSVLHYAVNSGRQELLPY